MKTEEEIRDLIGYLRSLMVLAETDREAMRTMIDTVSILEWVIDEKSEFTEGDHHRIGVRKAMAAENN